jgi:hypothetical protein
MHVSATKALEIDLLSGENSLNTYSFSKTAGMEVEVGRSSKRGAVRFVLLGRVERCAAQALRLWFTMGVVIEIGRSRFRTNGTGL